MRRGPRINRLNHILYIPENFFSVSHYYTDEEKIDPSTVAARMDNIVTHWI